MHIKNRKSSIEQFFINLILEIVVFIDFLENLPQKIIKAYIRIALYTMVFAVFVGLIAIELRYSYMNNIILYNYIDVNTTSSSLLKTKIPVKISDTPFPGISAQSALVVDVVTGTTLYEKNIYQHFPPASTTKLLTALVALDLYSTEQVLTVPEFCTSIDTQRIGLLPNERVNVHDLIYALLISSAGDAACVLETGIIDSKTFIQKMNEKAFALGMNNSSFTNSIGLDATDNSNYSSAKDLFILSKAAVENEFIKEIVGTKEYIIETNKFSRVLYNTNDLLFSVPGTVGVKTGRTYGAGEVLSYEYKDANINLIIIVMKSDNRFSDTQVLLNWVLSSFRF